MLLRKLSDDTVRADSTSREELILEHLPQVQLIAKRIQRGLPPCVSLEDLVSAGTLGLIAAIDKFDAQQHVKLRTYAEYRIRGAILDSLRALDWAPREKRKQARRIENAIAHLEKQEFRTPTVDEIASYLDMSIDECRSCLADMNGFALNSLENPGREKDSRDLSLFLSSKEDERPSKLFERAEQASILREHVNKLQDAERRILELYFYEEKTLKEISAVVHLHESRVSQLKTQALLHLKEYLEAIPTQQSKASAA